MSIKTSEQTLHRHCLTAVELQFGKCFSTRRLIVRPQSGCSSWQEQMTVVEASKVHRSMMDGFSNSVLQV